MNDAYGTPIVAVIGDGQLARMMHTEAIELGLAPRVLAGSREASAAQVFGDVRLGDYHNLADLEATAADATAVTFDHEHVPNEHLHSLIDAGVAVEPRPEALIYAQDKLEQRARLRELGLPVPPFAAITSVDDASRFFDEVDGQVCLKATRGGYDGHGVWFPETREELAEQVATILAQDVGLYAEAKVAFVRELSAMVARNRSGQVEAWPVVESRQDGGICRVAISPAPELSDERARYCRDLAIRIAEELDVTGVLAVELFETADGVLVNELAMRAQHRPLDPGRLRHLAVRAAPARSAGLAAGIHRTDCPGDRDGQHPGRRRGPRNADGRARGGRHAQIPGGEDPPLRQELPPGAQDGPC